MNSRTPLASIVSICYNHSKFVIENLNAIINQSYKNIELIIMDDCSTDNSVEVIVQWIRDNNIKCRFIAHKENKGVCATMNEAIELSKGKYICLIAADDVMEMDKTSLQVELLENSNNNVMLCVSNFSEIDKDSKLIKEKYFSKNFQLPKNIFKELLNAKGLLLHSPTAMVKASVFEEIGLYNEKYIQEDLYMWLKITDKFEVSFINEPLVKYRILATSLSKNEIYKEKMIKDRILVLESFLKDKGSEKEELLLFSIFKNASFLIDFYLKKKKFLEIMPQIKLQEKYFKKTKHNKALIELLEAELTNIFMHNPALAKELIGRTLFKKVSFLKKIVILYLPNTLINKYRNFRNRV